MLAVANGVAAVVVWRAGFGRKVESVDVDAFINQLQEASDGGTDCDTTALATVWPKVIWAPIVPSQKRALPTTSIVFRDELLPSQWRMLATRLRHQSRAALRPHKAG